MVTGHRDGWPSIPGRARLPGVQLAHLYETSRSEGRLCTSARTPWGHGRRPIAELRPGRGLRRGVQQAGYRKRRGARGGRPVGYDVADYKNHNVVERFFNRMKNWRGLASRFDKHVLTYGGGVLLAAILDWLT